jgi:TetR/AcrR family transcriptional regulator
MGRSKGSIDSSDETARNNLLTSALKLFNCKGYAGATVREIVADAGVTKPVLYYYFGNKEGIYIELLEGSFKKLEDLLDSFHSEEGKVSEKLVTLYDKFFGLICENIETVRLMHSIYYGPPQGAPFYDFEAYHRKLQDAVERLVEEGIRAGEFRTLDVNDATLAIVGVLHVAMNSSLCQISKAAVTQDGLSRLLNVIFQGILKKE